jgi:hypothetical protein
MNKITLHKDYLKNELNLPDNAIKNDIIDTSRWSIHHSIIFAYDNKFYRTWYSEGATECQDESPWEYDNDIECVQVELKEVMVRKWVEV